MPIEDALDAMQEIINYGEYMGVKFAQNNQNQGDVVNAPLKWTTEPPTIRRQWYWVRFPNAIEGPTGGPIAHCVWLRNDGMIRVLGESETWKPVTEMAGREWAGPIPLPEDA